MPKPIAFSECNVVIGAGQEEYDPLPCSLQSDLPTAPVFICWEFTDEEVRELVATKRLWHTVWTFGHKFQPTRLTTKKPADL